MCTDLLTIVRDLLYLAGGGFAALAGGIVLFVGVMTWLLGFPERRDAATVRRQAAVVLRQHGLTPQLYLPTVDGASEELKRALTEYACAGYVILDAKQNIIGKVCSIPVPQPEKPCLRLVVSNG